MNKQCKDCIYWDKWKFNIDIVFGYCRKNPPIVISQSALDKAIWPLVEETDWCGEFKEYDD